MKLKTKNGYEFEIDDDDYQLVSQFTWETIKPGKKRTYIITHITKNGKKRIQYLHRLLMWTVKEDQIDHINGNTLDNRKSNLRICTHGQNQANRGKLKNNTSGYKGVTWNKNHNKWEAQIERNGRHIWLGFFESPIRAASAYNEAAIIYFGEFAKLNELLPKTHALY